MAFFGVTEETIATSVHHPNADRLNICTLKGMNFQFVTGRDEYKPGDRVLYFPIDSILPQPLIEKLGLSGKLSGKNRDRVKTVTLRGEISQGIVGPLSLIDPVEMGGSPMGMPYHPEEITRALGVTKYEPPPVFVGAANLVALPCGLSEYDIEGADRYAEVITSLMDQRVSITEKVEGMNFSVTHDHTNNIDYVNQRNYSIKPIDGKEHSFWKAAKNQGLIEFARSLHGQVWVDLERGNMPSHVTVYGEFLGPNSQGNYYKMKDNEVRLFDIKIDGKFVGVDQFQLLSANHKVVPIIAHNVILREWLNGRSVADASNGMSILDPSKMREGIVIKPMVEGTSYVLKGRLIIKQRSPQYLAKSDL